MKSLTITIKALALIGLSWLVIVWAERKKKDELSKS